MRLLHFLFVVAMFGIVFALARDPMARVFMIVFATGLGEIVFGLMALMGLFQTVGAIGEARGLPEHAEALAATSFVLAVGTAAMSGWLFIGAWLVVMFA